MRRAKPYMEGFHDPKEEEPMEMLSRPSGLVVPKPPPEPPPRRKYGPMEVWDTEDRERVKEALLLLWDALDLSSGGGGIVAGPVDAYSDHYRLYRFVGEMLLGDDCPEKEVLT